MPAARIRRAGLQARAPRPAATTNSRCVRPPARLSEPRARNRPRSQAARQWSAADGPGERAAVAPVALAPTEPDGEPRDGRLAPHPPPTPGPAASAARSHVRDGSIAASSSRRAVTRSRSTRLIVRPSGPRTVGARRGSRSSRPEQRDRQPGRVVVVRVVGIDHVVEHRRGSGRRPRAASAGVPARRSSRVASAAAKRLLARTRSIRLGPVWATSASTWRGEVEPGRSRRPGWPRCRRRRAAPRRPATASRIAGMSRTGSRLVYRLPGPRTMSSASAIAASASSDAATSSGVIQTRSMPAVRMIARLPVDDRAVGQARVEGQRRRRDGQRPGRGRRGSGSSRGCRPRSRRPRPRSPRR